MSVIDIIVWAFNSLTGLNFSIMSLSDLSVQAASFTTWVQIFDFNFLSSTIIYLSVFYFTWKMIYQLFFRLLMNLIQFPKKRANK